MDDKENKWKIFDNVYLDSGEDTGRTVLNKLIRLLFYKYWRISSLGHKLFVSRGSLCTVDIELLTISC
jgi:hypothetical protein